MLLSLQWTDLRKHHKPLTPTAHTASLQLSAGQPDSPPRQALACSAPTEGSRSSDFPEHPDRLLVDLVLRDDPGLGERGTTPLLEGRRRHDRLHVGLANRIGRERVAVEAGD